MDEERLMSEKAKKSHFILTGVWRSELRRLKHAGRNIEPNNMKTDCFKWSICLKASASLL